MSPAKARETWPRRSPSSPGPLKAPSLREAAARLAERARAESWTHEEFLIACLQREIAARESHDGEGHIRAAGGVTGGQPMLIQRRTS
jgi:hypothetical protein